MKRLWAAAVLLLLTFALCAFGLYTTHNLTAVMTISLNEIKSDVQKGNTGAALTLSEETSKSWHKYHLIMCTYMPHQRLEAIDQSLAVLPPLIRYGANDQFEAECDRAVAQIEHLKDTEVPSLANIL